MVRFVKMMIMALLLAGSSAKAQSLADIDAVIALNNTQITTATGFHAVTHIVEGNMFDTTLKLLRRAVAGAIGGNLESVTTAGNVTDQGIGIIPPFFTSPGFDGIYILPDNTIQWPYITSGGLHLYNGYLTYVPLGADTKVYLPYEPANNTIDIPQSTLVTHRTKDGIEISTGSGGTFNAGFFDVQSYQWEHSGSEHGFLGWRDYFVDTGGGGAGYDVIGSMLTMKDKTLTGTGTILPPNAILTDKRFYTMPNASGYLALSGSSDGITSADHGGTGIANNVLSTWKITGSFPTTVNVTAATNVTLPITGTLYGTRASSITSAQMLNSMSDAVGINHLVFSDNPLFGITVTFIDGCNFICGATTGTKFGTGTTQKMGWWNTTPVVQQSGDVATALSLYGLVSAPTVSLSNNVTGTVAAANGGTGNGITTVAGTSYMLLASDWGHTIICTSASAVTLTVPAGLPAGFKCDVVQAGAGLITPTASGTTLVNGDLYTKSAGINLAFTIINVGTNQYLMQGRMQ